MHKRGLVATATRVTVRGADGICPIAEEARKEVGGGVTVISEGRGVIDQENAYKIGPGHVGWASPQVPFRDLLSFPGQPALAVGDSPQFSPLPGATTVLAAHVLTRTSDDAKARVPLASQSRRPTAPRSH